MRQLWDNLGTTRWLLGDYWRSVPLPCEAVSIIWSFFIAGGWLMSGTSIPIFWKWTEVRKYSILSRMQDWPRFTRYLKGVHWAFRISNKMYIPFVPIWTKDSFLLYLVGHKTQLFIVILQIRAGRKFLGHFALLHRKVANPATTNCSFADSIHESFSYLVFFFVNKHKDGPIFFWPHPNFTPHGYNSQLQLISS